MPGAILWAMVVVPVAALLVAVSEAAGRASLVGQFGAVILAVFVGRLFRSRGAISCVAIVGAVGAMFAQLVVDGQGAFLLLLWVPGIYWASVSGRDDLTA